MADTRTRWLCSCGSFRFLIPGIDRRICQQCGLSSYYSRGMWWNIDSMASKLFDDLDKDDIDFYAGKQWESE